MNDLLKLLQINLPSDFGFNNYLNLKIIPSVTESEPETEVLTYCMLIEG